MRGGFVVLFAGAAIAFHSAAASSLFSLGAPISQPSAGLRFRVFRSMKPLPLPAIRAERRSDGAKLIRNRDYWLCHQTAGLWSGDGGSV